MQVQLFDQNLGNQRYIYWCALQFAEYYMQSVNCLIVLMHWNDNYYTDWFYLLAFTPVYEM